MAVSKSLESLRKRYVKLADRLANRTLSSTKRMMSLDFTDLSKEQIREIRKALTSGFKELKALQKEM